MKNYANISDTMTAKSIADLEFQLRDLRKRVSGCKALASRRLFEGEMQPAIAATAEAHDLTVEIASITRDLFVRNAGLLGQIAKAPQTVID